MRQGEHTLLQNGWGVSKHNKKYALIFGDNEQFSYVAVGFSRLQAKKEIKRIIKQTPDCKQG